MRSDLRARIRREAKRSAVPFVQICYRTVNDQYAARTQLLSAYGSFIAGGRYNSKGGFEALYLSCALSTCIAEIERAASQLNKPAAELLPRKMIGLELSLSNILDLTDLQVQSRLGITSADLMEEWLPVQKSGGDALTQQIGRHARDAGLEAILYPSAAQPDGKNLAVFPDNLRPESRIEIINADRLRD